MIYDYECACGIVEERFVHTFDQADDEVCKCGEKMNRLIAGNAKVDVWDNSYIEEIDPEKKIRVRSLRHAKEIARSQGLSVNQDVLSPFDLVHRIHDQEKDARRPYSVDYGRKTG